jgi:hypothetical protein
MLTVIVIVALIVAAGTGAVVATRLRVDWKSAWTADPAQPTTSVIEVLAFGPGDPAITIKDSTDVEDDTRPSGVECGANDVGASGEAEVHTGDGGSVSRLMPFRARPDRGEDAPVADPETGSHGTSAEVPAAPRRASTPVTPRKLPTPRSKNPEPPQWKKWNADMRWNGMVVEDER